MNRLLLLLIVIVFVMLNFGCRKNKPKEKISKSAFSLSKIYYKEARKQAENGNFTKSEGYFLKSYQHDQKFVQPLVHLSYLYRIKGNTKKEITVLQQIIRNFPDSRYARDAEEKIHKMLSSMKTKLK